MLKINIYTKDITLTPAIEEYVNERLKGLEKFSKVPLEISLELEKTTHHHYKGYVFRAEIQTHVKGALLRAESIKEDLRVAIVEVRKELERELIKRKNKRETMAEKGGRLFKKLFRK
jgi:ribosomal subunit interface protein